MRLSTPPPTRAVAPRPIPVEAPLALGHLLALALMGGYALLRLKRPDWWDLLDEVNLAIHEAGHVVFGPFGETLGILGGSLFQVIVPAAFVIYFARTRQRLGVSATLIWVGASLLNVARYVADARARDLPLLGGNDDNHDWWLLLDGWNALPLDGAIARAIRAAAAVTFLLATTIGLLSLRARAPER